MPDGLHFLLVEPDTLLRRTVAMTARSLHLGHVHEAADGTLALRMLQARRFDGIVVAVDCVGDGGERRYDLDLIDRLRESEASSTRQTPVAIMTAEASPGLLADVRARRISRVILKPFRAKVLLDTIAGFSLTGKNQPASVGMDRARPAPPAGRPVDAGGCECFQPCNLACTIEAPIRIGKSPKA